MHIKKYDLFAAKKRCVTYCIVKIVKLLSFSYPLLIRNVGLSLLLFSLRDVENAIDYISIYFHFDSKTAEAFFKFATLFSEGCIIAIDLSVFIFISISRQLQYS